MKKVFTSQDLLLKVFCTDGDCPKLCGDKAHLGPGPKCALWRLRQVRLILWGMGGRITLD